MSTAKIVTSTVVAVTVGDVIIEGEFRGVSLPGSADDALRQAYSSSPGASFVAIASAVLTLVRKAAFDCTSVSIQYTATAYAVATLEEIK